VRTLKFSLKTMFHQLWISRLKIEISRVRSLENFYVNLEKVKEVLYRVIQSEGPVNIDEVKRRIASRWAIDRVENRGFGSY
jgi:hypothetical protein